VKIPELVPIDDAPMPAARRYFDAHVHPWPAKLYAAIGGWFDAHAWRIEERVDGEAWTPFSPNAASPGTQLDLRAQGGDGRGAQSLDGAMGGGKAARCAARHSPSADDVAAVVEEALGPLGLKGLKLHAHVMGFPPDDPRLFCRL